MTGRLDWRRAKQFRERESIKDEPRPLRDRLDKQATWSLRRFSKRLSQADRELFGLGGKASS